MGDALADAMAEIGMRCDAPVHEPPVVRLTLPFPPSANHYWRHVIVGRGVRTLLSRRGRAYKTLVCDYVRGRGLAGRLAGRLAVEVKLFPPNRLRRDVDNFGGKALLDALTTAGVWQDDSQVDELLIRRCAVVAGGQCVVDIRTLDSGARV